MAKIEFEKGNNGKILFEDLEVGTCFVIWGKTYMKIDLLRLKDESIYAINAIMLESGKDVFFENDTIIEENRIYNTIQLKKE